MNEMYTMTIAIHRYGAFVMIALMLMNMLHLRYASEIKRYARQMRTVMPLMASLLALMLFTGVVMMAAKHLSFSLENIIMIIMNIAWIVLEAKRYGTLKRTNPEMPNALDAYRAKAMRFLAIELGGSVAITLWMLLS